MKPTRLLTNVKQLLELACSCTQDHDHIMLRGRAPTGEFWTALACAYPPLLCKAYARGVQAAIRAERLDTRPRVIGGVSSSARPRWCPPVDQAWAEPGRWQLEWKGLWKYREHINVQEARTVMLLAKPLSRSTQVWDHKVLVMVDSLVTLGAVRKMRSRAGPLQRQVLSVAMVTLATGVRMLLRWVPSAWNPADGPSRGGPVGADPETIKKHAEDMAQDPLDDLLPGSRLPGLLLARGHL